MNEAKKLDTPEDALRAIKQQNLQVALQRFNLLDQIFGDLVI